MTGVQPCSLIPDAQLASLGPGVKKVPAPQPNGPGLTCLLSSVQAPGGISEILAAPGEGVARYTGSSSTRTSTPITVAGFPALSVTRPVEKYNCIVVVDVADGQSLQTQRDDDTGRSLDQICSAAQSLAETAMTALLAQK